MHNWLCVVDTFSMQNTCANQSKYRFLKWQPSQLSFKHVVVRFSFHRSLNFWRKIIDLFVCYRTKVRERTNGRKTVLTVNTLCQLKFFYNRKCDSVWLTSVDFEIIKTHISMDKSSANIICDVICVYQIENHVYCSVLMTLRDKVTIWCDKNLSKEMPIKKSFKRQTLSAISANCIANFLFAW